MIGSDMFFNFAYIFEHFLTLGATIKWIFDLRIIGTVFIFFFDTDMRDRIDCNRIWGNCPWKKYFGFVLNQESDCFDKESNNTIFKQRLVKKSVKIENWEYVEPFKYMFESQKDKN